MFFNTRVVILNRVSGDDRDDDGNKIPTTIGIEARADVQPASSSELAQHVDVSESDYVAYLPLKYADYLTSASSVWVADLGEYGIQGEPGRWLDGPRSYVEVGLKRVAGASDDRSEP